MTRLLHARAVYRYARETWHLGHVEAAAIAWRAFVVMGVRAHEYRRGDL